MSDEQEEPQRPNGHVKNFLQAVDRYAQGKDLLEIKARLKHGQFLNYLEQEFARTPRAAQQIMQFAKWIDKWAGMDKAQYPEGSPLLKAIDFAQAVIQVNTSMEPIRQEEREEERKRDTAAASMNFMHNYSTQYETAIDAHFKSEESSYLADPVKAGQIRATLHRFLGHDPKLRTNVSAEEEAEISSRAGGLVRWIEEWEQAPETQKEEAEDLVRKQLYSLLERFTSWSAYRALKSEGPSHLGGATQ